MRVQFHVSPYLILSVIALVSNIFDEFNTAANNVIANREGATSAVISVIKKHIAAPDICMPALSTLNTLVDKNNGKIYRLLVKHIFRQWCNC